MLKVVFFKQKPLSLSRHGEGNVAPFLATVLQSPVRAQLHHCGIPAARRASFCLFYVGQAVFESDDGRDADRRRIDGQTRRRHGRRAARRVVVANAVLGNVCTLLFFVGSETKADEATDDLFL